MNLYTIPAEVPFLDALAAAWLDGAKNDPARIADGLILLPTRRAARALATAFLRLTEGRPLLLPRITAFGALDETPLALAGALDLAPAVDPALRLAHLTRLILALDGAAGAPRSAERAWKLAVELAALMDEAEREGVDLAASLPRATGGEFAAHWQQTLDFLAIVTRAWPDWLADCGLMNPAARQVALLTAQARAWEAKPPDFPLWAAGSTGGIPAVARLLGVVARLPRGRVVLPGFDADLPADLALPESHPQFGLARLLAAIGATAGDVRPWPATGVAAIAPAHRVALLNRALLPAPALHLWRHAAPIAEPHGLMRLAPADEHQEALAIALILRDALERPGARAALVTPDRALAGRVTAELARFGVIADDSAGEPLAETPPAVFLRLLATAATSGLAPVPLLALLKHPFAAAGFSPPEARFMARALERAGLRGPRPAPGIVGLRRAIASAAERATLDPFLTAIETALAPLLRLAASVGPVAVDDMLAALIEAGEALARDAEAPGAARLWAFEEGAALAETLAAALPALAVLPPQRLAILPELFETLIAGAVVRSRRSLRGREGSELPRVMIWGLLEARLQTADLIVLGGLAEAMWPPATDPGPWLSRPMRAAIGLASPEIAIGQSAHDFVMAACGAPEVVLSCPRRRERAPVVPARWLTRLDALRRAKLPAHPATAWARLLDQPDGPPRPVAPPTPRPPRDLRPRRLSVTEIETWLCDPYAIYARHILRLRALPPLDQPVERSDFGEIVHQALARFYADLAPGNPAPALAARLRTIIDVLLTEARIRPALTAWWRPRLDRIADWVAAWEAARGTDFPAHIASERAGRWDVDGAREFLLTARADRIERTRQGGIVLIDYKTGMVPAQSAVARGRAPQLTLEAAMAAAGGFGPDYTGRAAALSYWRLTGGVEPGQEIALFADDPAALGAAIAAAEAGLIALIRRFDDPGTPYLSEPHPDWKPRWSDYAQLARVAEWAAGETAA